MREAVTCPQTCPALGLRRRTPLEDKRPRARRGRALASHGWAASAAFGRARSARDRRSHRGILATVRAVAMGERVPDLGRAVADRGSLVEGPRKRHPPVWPAPSQCDLNPSRVGGRIMGSLLRTLMQGPKWPRACEHALLRVRMPTCTHARACSPAYVAAAWLERVPSRGRAATSRVSRLEGARGCMPVRLSHRPARTPRVAGAAQRGSFHGGLFDTSKCIGHVPMCIGHMPRCIGYMPTRIGHAQVFRA